MNVLIDSSWTPFYLAHGGAHTQVAETIKALLTNDLNAEYSRWWDSSQKPDLIHTFGVPDSNYQFFAHTKNIPIVNTTLFTSQCNRSKFHLRLQGCVTSAILKIPSFPIWSSIRSQLKWEAYKSCDMHIVGLKAEVDVLKSVYGIPEHRIKTLPLGLADSFLSAAKGSRENNYLITTGTITERKRSVELAQLAHATGTPICFVGKPYDPGSNYWKSFIRLVDNKTVTHIPHTDSIDHMIELLGQAKGFVLYSDFENWCLSAHEAIACGLPILVPKQNWSYELFGENASYFDRKCPHADTLVRFYKSCDNLTPPDIKLYSWDEVAEQLIDIYKSVLKDYVK